jgi:prolyl-tRNA editing enzyme YbaK/EbsC (Cys-tRNA(Pro) deacylase)
VEEPSSRVQAALDKLDLGIRVRRFEAPTSTASEAAAAIGCDLGAIVKSLCFLIDGRPAMVLVAGDRQVDQKALRQILGVSKRQIKIAEPGTVLTCTGFAVGGVPPIGHTVPLPTLIDRSLSRFQTVYAAAGDAHSIFAIGYEDLVRVTGGQVLDLAQ